MEVNWQRPIIQSAHDIFAEAEKGVTPESPKTKKWIFLPRCPGASQYGATNQIDKNVPRSGGEANSRPEPFPCWH